MSNLLVNTISTSFVTLRMETMAQMIRQSRRCVHNLVNCIHTLGRTYFTSLSTMQCNSSFEGKTILPVASTFHVHTPEISLSSSDITFRMDSFPSMTLIKAVRASFLWFCETPHGKYGRILTPRLSNHMEQQLILQHDIWDTSLM
jgi:hypothetical protein